MNPEGFVFKLNLTTPFSLSDNQTNLFSTVPRRPSSSPGTVVQNYFDGAALSNDAQVFLYGGLTEQSDTYPDPGARDVSRYQGYPDDGEDPGFSAGFSEDELPDGVTRYVAYGAGVSAPSENKAWYFSGLRAPDKGAIHRRSFNEETIPTNVSDTLISVTFGEDAQSAARWENKTLPGSVRGRASASGVFVPVGEQGILVFVGGATHPDFASTNPYKDGSEDPAALVSLNPPPGCRPSPASHQACGKEIREHGLHE